MMHSTIRNLPWNRSFDYTFGGILGNTGICELLFTDQFPESLFINQYQLQLAPLATHASGMNSMVGLCSRFGRRWAPGYFKGTSYDANSFL
jgi:hypothetical protein